MGQILAAEYQAGRAVLAHDCLLPGHRRLDRIARTPDVVVGDVAQGRQVLDRLVGRAVLAQTDGVMGVDVDDVGRDQRTHAQRIAGVVGEHHEGGIERQKAAVQGQAIGDGAHAELAYAVIDVVGVGVIAGHRGGALPQGQVGMGQVGRTTDDFRQQRREGGNRVL